MFLYQIENYQNKLKTGAAPVSAPVIAQQPKKRESLRVAAQTVQTVQAAPELAKFEYSRKGILPLTESGVHQLDVFVLPIDKTNPPKKYMVDEAEAKKMMATPAPISMHDRIHAALEQLKDKPDAPKTLREFLLMSVDYTLTAIESQKK